MRLSSEGDSAENIGPVIPRRFGYFRHHPELAQGMMDNTVRVCEALVLPPRFDLVQGWLFAMVDTHGTCRHWL